MQIPPESLCISVVRQILVKAMFSVNFEMIFFNPNIFRYSTWLRAFLFRFRIIIFL